MKQFTGRVLRAIESARASKPQASWSGDEIKRLKILWEQYGGRVHRIAREMGRTPGSIAGKSRILGLQFHGGRATVLKAGDKRLVGMATVHTHMVRRPDGAVLKSGDNQRKLGPRITKGIWKGLPLYSLTLEERATCSDSCPLLAACYGNNMGRSIRYRHGEALEASLYRELTALQHRHPRGFVVRLHILGDFYEPRYVHFWAACLERFPALQVFGYTAWQPDTEIGSVIARIRDRYWDRFAIRTSGAKEGPRTMVIDPHATCIPMRQERDHPIICPAQTGKTKNCGTCGLCWSAAAKDRPIAFLQH